MCRKNGMEEPVPMSSSTTLTGSMRPMLATAISLPVSEGGVAAKWR